MRPCAALTTGLLCALRRFALVIGLVGLCAGCAAVRPLSSPEHKPDAATGLPLSGDYIATFKAPVLGGVQGRFTARPTRDGFVAATRPDVAWDMIGGLEGFLGSIFIRSLFPDGSILTWTSTSPHDGGPAEGILGPGDVKNASVHTRMTSVDAPVDLSTPGGPHVATMTLRATGPDDGPMADYPALAWGVERAMQEHLFDASLLKSSQVRGYLRQLKSNAKDSRDDIEFIFGAVVAGRGNLKFALPLVFTQLDPDWRSQLRALAEQGVATLKVGYDEDTGVATLKCEAFIDAEDVDRAFEEALKHHPRGILLDLSSCPGVTLASLRVASWVTGQPTDAGMFFGPSRREEARAGRLGEFPRLNLNSAESVDNIEHELDTTPGARIVVTPAEHRFTGPVAVLTGKKTTTSAESLIWTLRSAGAAEATASGSPRIRIFGQPTAGRPTLSRPIDIGPGWVVWLAALDYRPPGGERSDRGCRPTDEDPSKDRSKQAAMDWLQRTTQN
jgi:Peptidase family S41